MAVGMVYDAVMRAGEERVRWLKHYCSSHKILLVGEGDFSFSLSLALFFGSASNIVATSLDSHDELSTKYKQAISNVETLRALGAKVFHGVDANAMESHPVFGKWKFDRIIFNFPHAGFYGKEDDWLLIQLHMNIVYGFFRNARGMLRTNGEIHVNHKTTKPFNLWNIVGLASENSLALISCVNFKAEDYPGYNNKRGDGPHCDNTFPLRRCSTFKFTLWPHTKKMPQVLPITFQNFMAPPIATIPPPSVPYYELQQPLINFTPYANNLPVYGGPQPTAGFSSECSRIFQGDFSHGTETYRRSGWDVYNPVDKASDLAYATYRAEVPGRDLNGYMEPLGDSLSIGTCSERTLVPEVLQSLNAETVRQPIATMPPPTVPYYEFQQPLTNFTPYADNLPVYGGPQPTASISNECSRIIQGDFSHGMETFGRSDFDVYNPVHKASDLAYATCTAEVPGRDLNGNMERIEGNVERLEELLRRILSIGTSSEGTLVPEVLPSLNAETVGQPIATMPPPTDPYYEFQQPLTSFTPYANNLPVSAGPQPTAGVSNECSRNFQGDFSHGMETFRRSDFNLYNPVDKADLGYGTGMAEVPGRDLNGYMGTCSERTLVPEVLPSLNPAHSTFQNLVATPIETVQQPIATMPPPTVPYYEFQQPLTNFSPYANNLPVYAGSLPTACVSNECSRNFQGDFSYGTETFRRSNWDVYNPVDKALDLGYATCMAGVPGRDLNGYMGPL